MLGGVVKEFEVYRGGVSDPLSVGRPGRLGLLAWKAGHLQWTRSLVGVIGGDPPNVGIVGAVGIRGGAIALKGQRLSVRRPGRCRVIEVAGGYLALRFCRDREDIEVGTAAFNVADVVGLELEAVEHPRWLRLGFLGRPVVAVFFFL